MKKGKFPYMGAIILVLGVLWLLKDLNLIVVNLPWIPILLIVIAIGMIVNSYSV